MVAAPRRGRAVTAEPARPLRSNPEVWDLPWEFSCPKRLHSSGSAGVGGWSQARKPRCPAGGEKPFFSPLCQSGSVPGSENFSHPDQHGFFWDFSGVMPCWEHGVLSLVHPGSTHRIQTWDPVQTPCCGMPGKPEISGPGTPQEAEGCLSGDVKHQDWR